MIPMMEISGIISGLFPPNHRLPLTPKSSQGLRTGLLWLERLSQSVFGQWLSLDPRQDGVTARDTGWSRLTEEGGSRYFGPSTQTFYFRSYTLTIPRMIPPYNCIDTIDSIYHFSRF